MSNRSLRWSDPCPSCQKPIRWYHLLASPLAPFYFKCPHCKARLRMSRPGQVMAACGWAFGLAMLLLLAGACYPALALPWRLFGAGLLAIVVAVLILLLYPLQGGRMRVREPALAAEPAARSYLVTGVLTLVTMLILVVPLSFGIGMAAIWVEEMTGGLSFGPEFPAVSELTPLGKVPEGWTVRPLDGKPVSLGELRGKVLFINIWATWCGPCVAEMPSIQALYHSINDPEIVFLIVSREPPDTVRKFVEKKEWDLPFYLAAGDVPAILQTEGIPATFIVNRQGEVVFQHVGSTDWDTEDCRRFLRSVP